MSPPQERLVPLVEACGLFMENLGSTVLATALPAIALNALAVQYPGTDLTLAYEGPGVA